MKKFILLLWSVLSFGQASNQMVTFTQAQSLGFALKSGQSHVTSNQCMTKADILAKYNVTISGYADNQLVPRSAWVSGASSFNFELLYGDCNFREGTLNLYSSQSTITNGMTIYSDPALQYFYAGRDEPIYQPATNKWFAVNIEGIVYGLTECITPVTAYEYRFNSNNFSVSTYACIDISGEIIKYSPDGILILGSILYNEASLTTVFNGLNSWRKMVREGNDVIYIDTNGGVVDFQNCN